VQQALKGRESSGVTTNGLHMTAHHDYRFAHHAPQQLTPFLWAMSR